MNKPDLTISRLWETPFGTFGHLATGWGTDCWTLELPWRDNRVGISCIPPGTYPYQIGIHHGEPGRSDDYECVEVLEVPGRTEIEIHRGNTFLDTAGCVLVGSAVGVVAQSWAILDSRNQLDHLLRQILQADAGMGILEVTYGLARPPRRQEGGQIA